MCVRPEGEHRGAAYQEDEPGIGLGLDISSSEMGGGVQLPTGPTLSKGSRSLQWRLPDIARCQATFPVLGQLCLVGLRLGCYYVGVKGRH